MPDDVRPSLAFRKAVPGDEAVVAGLINSAYRGDSSRAGWTTEADLLKGPRTNAGEVLSLIIGVDSMMLRVDSRPSAFEHDGLAATAGV